MLDPASGAMNSQMLYHIVGAEEAFPMIANAKLLAKVLGFPYFPITWQFPWLGPLGVLPLPQDGEAFFIELADEPEHDRVVDLAVQVATACEPETRNREARPQFECALMLRGLAGRLTSEYPAILPEIEGITRLVNNSIESTRALARGLSPVNLERGGLSDALEGLAMHATELYGVQVTCTHRVKTLRPLSAELANHLYRIAQEAVVVGAANDGPSDAAVIRPRNRTVAGASGTGGGPAGRCARSTRGPR